MEKSLTLWVKYHTITHRATKERTKMEKKRFIVVCIFMGIILIMQFQLLSKIDKLQSNFFNINDYISTKVDNITSEIHEIQMASDEK